MKSGIGVSSAAPRAQFLRQGIVRPAGGGLEPLISLRDMTTRLANKGPVRGPRLFGGAWALDLQGYMLMGSYGHCTAQESKSRMWGPMKFGRPFPKVGFQFRSHGFEFTNQGLQFTNQGL